MTAATALLIATTTAYRRGAARCTGQLAVRTELCQIVPHARTQHGGKCDSEKGTGWIRRRGSSRDPLCIACAIEDPGEGHQSDGGGPAARPEQRDEGRTGGAARHRHGLRAEDHRRPSL